MTNRFLNNVDVKGVRSGSIGRFDFHTEASNIGMPVYKDDMPDGGDLLHHKFIVIDAGKPDSDPIVITGSHNWTSAADDNNDENTLIIHSSEIASKYLSEFQARYTEAGGQ